MIALRRKLKAGDASDSETHGADGATHGAAGCGDLPISEPKRKGSVGYELNEPHESDDTKQHCTRRQLGICQCESHHRRAGELVCLRAPERRAIANICRIELLAFRREAARFGDSWLSHDPPSLYTRLRELCAAARGVYARLCQVYVYKSRDVL